MFSLEKRRLWADLITACPYLPGGHQEDGASLFTIVHHGRRRPRMRHELKQERFRLGIRANILPIQTVKHWGRLPREIVPSPSSEVFKS